MGCAQPDPLPIPFRKTAGLRRSHFQEIKNPNRAGWIKRRQGSVGVRSSNSYRAPFKKGLAEVFRNVCLHGRKLRYESTAYPIIFLVI